MTPEEILKNIVEQATAILKEIGNPPALPGGQ